ncbi:MAG: S8 family peptidase [Bacteroidota bacterium]
MNRPIIILLLLIGSNLILHAQVNRYFVYFSDKNAPDYSYSLENPGAFLTVDALDRRAQQSIVPDSTDLPVAASYLAGVSDLGADVYFSSKWLNGALVQMSESLVATISNLAYVDSVALIAEKSRLSRTSETVIVPTSFQSITSMTGTSDLQLMMLNVDQMHREGYRGEGMRIAVLDNGFRGVNTYEPFSEIWSENRIVGTKDFVQNSGNVYQFGSHGTNVLSIIGAEYENDTAQYIGAAPKAEFIFCITEENGSEDRIEEYNWLLGAEFADSLGADVINSSVGYRSFDIADHNYDFKDTDGNSAIVSVAATMAASKGIVVVTSAGNTGGSSNAQRKVVSHPADARGVFTVGSVMVNLDKSIFSSIGPTVDGRLKPDVSAFGDATAIVNSNGTITRGSGTSFSTPLIAGLVAGVWQANPSFTSEEIIRVVRRSAHLAESPNNLLGYGVPNYTFAVNGDRTLAVNDILDETIQVFPNPFQGDKLYLRSSQRIKGGLRIQIFDRQGRLMLEESIPARETKNDVTLQLENPDPGLYFLVLTAGEVQRTIKIINF